MKPLASRKTASPLIATMAGITLTASALHAAPVIHESANYTATSELNGAAATGTGLTGNWSNSANGVTAQTSSMSYGSLAQSNNEIQLNSNPAKAASVNIGPELNAAGLLDHGATLWFSFLVNPNASSGSNDNLAFAFGTDRLGTGNATPMNSSGNGVGVGYDRGTNCTAAYWNNGTRVNQFAGSGMTKGAANLIVVKVQWGATASDPETITVYKPATDLAPPAPHSSFATAVPLDQSTFDTITFTHKNNLTGVDIYDEIRFGATYADVVPDSADVTAPSIASTVPVYDDTDANGVLQATYDGPIRVGSGDIRIYSGAAPGTLHTTITVPDAQVSVEDTSTLQIIPSIPLAAGVTYYVEMDAGVVQDSNSNPSAAFTGDGTWRFTADSTPPTVASVTSEYGNWNTFVGLSDELYTVTFDKPINGSTISAADFGGAGGDTGTATIGTVTQLDLYTFTVVVTPATAGTFTFTVLSANTVADLTGNTLAADFNHVTKTIQASAFTITHTGTTAVSNDTWSVAANWDGGFQPDKEWPATVATGIAARADSINAVPYSGGLTLASNASLMVGGSGSTEARIQSVNARGTGPITLNSGSAILWRIKDDSKFPPITVAGNALIEMASNEVHSRTYEFDAISGAGTLTVTGSNNQIFLFENDSSGWSGGLVTDNTDTNNDTVVKGTAANCFGTGNVTVESFSTLELDVDNTIGDGATLALNGSKSGTGSNKLVLDNPNPEVIGSLSLDGSPQAAGTYGRTGLGGVDFEVPWISGNGILDVTGDDNPGSLTVGFAAVGEGGSTTYAYETEPINYTLTFTAEHSPALTSADLETTSGIGFTVESVTAVPNELSGTLQYAVVVKATEPGLLNLRIKNTTVITDIFGNVLTVPAPDDDTLTIDAVPGIVDPLGVVKPWSNDRTNPATGLAWAEGDTFRLVMVTSAKTTFESNVIADYNAFVQGVAAGSTKYPNLGDGTWNVLGSTETVDAKVNTGTDTGVGVPVLLMDGATMLAEDNVDLWNGTAARPDLPGFFLSAYLDENAVEINDGSIATGTNQAGAIVSTQWFGNSSGSTKVNTGQTIPNNNTRWMIQFNQNNGSSLRVYALSAPITLVASGGGTTYATWLSGFTLTDTTFNGDDDGDNLGNGIEAFFGTDPSVSSTGIAEVGKSGNTVTFTHPNPDAIDVVTDVTGSYEWSLDLVTWYLDDGVEGPGATTVTTVATPDSPTANTTTVVATIGGTVPEKLFLRVVATQP